MNPLTRVFACCVYCVLLMVFSTLFAGLCCGLQEIALHWHEPARWGDIMFAVSLVASLCVGAVEWDKLWYLLLFFGCWASFLPPHRWWAHEAFVLTALAAGVWASYSFQMYEWPVFPFQAGLEILPPTFQLVSTKTAFSCIDALLSTTLCLYLVRRWFRDPPLNPTLQATDAGEALPS